MVKKIREDERNIQSAKVNYSGLVYLIPFIMTLLGFFTFTWFSHYTWSQPIYSLFLTFFFVSTGSIMLLAQVLAWKHQNSN